MTLRLGWFTTARGPGSRGMFEAVIAARAAGQLPGVDFAFVFCNRDRGEDAVTDAFLDRAASLDIPLVTRSSVGYRKAVGGGRSRPGEPLPAWRLDYDREVDAALEAYPFDLGVLAGYMLIFEREFSLRHPLLNLHPALPGGPTGTWREVIRELIRARAVESGIMLHLAIPEVDAGPEDQLRVSGVLEEAETGRLIATATGTFAALHGQRLAAVAADLPEATRALALQLGALGRAAAGPDTL